MENNYILKENLIEALKTAIHFQEKEELLRNYGGILPIRGESALLSGWKTALKSLQNGILEIR
jgi:hypothetical protein